MGINLVWMPTTLTVFSYRNWELMTEAFLTTQMLSEVANRCTDIIQTLSETILDVVLPQVYS